MRILYYGIDELFGLRHVLFRAAEVSCKRNWLLGTSATSVLPCTRGNAVSVLPCTRGNAVSVLPCTRGNAVSVLPCTRGNAVSVLPCTRGNAVSVLPCTRGRTAEHFLGFVGLSHCMGSRLRL